ncbi:general transcription factor 3C polypeptide 5-like isoform X2 [Chenopodium quinoa]|uniref:general transcription factor 3C polypeptide 5-like isoform X2 n=1 Tax=Chenopodium quinoa TaxID=63459 RepID=UPI000B76CE54|nr:general transcription factor 3C polypeptide 5-like isoform X2 [Chenopodium quinoa]
MGIIEDGTAKGFLPSEELFAVHYPAYPSSMSRAVETLGGIDAIAKARSSKLNKLELRFRPEDPCSHPAFGQIYPCNNLLLKISKGNSGGIQSNNCCSSQSKDCSSEKSEKPNVLSADIVARVPEAYNFTGMVDYQHVLAVHADAAQRKGSYNEVKGPFEKGDLGDADDENLMMLVPPLFSLKDVPENIVLRPSITLSSKKKQEGVVQHRWEMEIEPCLAIDFNIKEIPKRVNWEEYISRGSDQWKWQMVVSKLFDERPIWTRSSIHERLCKEGLKFGDHMLKRLLFRSAYYFGSGPFHRFWIRKGYDPRKDPESRIYQRIDFRVPPSLRGYCDAASGKKHNWEDLCAFRVFPYKCQTYFQLSELADDYIQNEIRKPPNHTVCTCSTGWYTSYVLDSLRLGVAVRFLSVYPLDGAESLLKRVSEKFEKSKKMRYQVNNLKPGEEGELQANPGDEDKGDDDDDDDDEDNEIEDEDGEEELDINDTVYLDGDDADFTLQSDSYLGAENISRNYLQELFESFPSTGASNQQLDGADVGEYQIYEQDSDGNYSDDY